MQGVIVLGVPGALAEAALSRPRALLGGLIVALLIAALVAGGAPASLGVPAAEPSDSQSADADDALAGALDREPDPGAVIVTHGDFPVRAGVYRVPLDVVSSQAETQSVVASVRRGPVSKDGRTTALEIFFDRGDEAAQQRAVDDIERNLDPGPLTARVGGQEAVALQARQTAAHDLGRLELLALPVALVILVAALGLRLAAGPILASATAIVGTLALLRIAGGIAEVSLLGILPGGAVGLTLGVEFCLALAARYREEVRQLRERGAALRRTMETTGRMILAASFVAAGAAAGLVLVPLAQVRSAALGAALAALLAGAAAVVAMPALISMYGAGSAAGDREPRGWGRVTRRLVPAGRARRVPALLGAGLLLLVAAPLIRGETVALGASALPEDASARRADERATKELGAGVTAPVLVTGSPRARAEARRLRDELERTEGVAVAAPPQRAGAELQLVRAGLVAAPESLGARRAVESVRAAPSPYETSVGGQDAAALDADRALFDHLPIAALAVALLAAGLLFRLVARPGSLCGALAVAGLLPAAAAGGLLVLVFQDERLAGALDYTAQGAVQLGALVALIAALVTISTARGALLAATAAERRSAGAEIAVRRGLSLTLPAGAIATAIAAAAGAVTVASGLLPLKEAGLGLATGLLLDLILVRGLIAPSLTRLLPARTP